MRLVDSADSDAQYSLYGLHIVSTIPSMRTLFDSREISTMTIKPIRTKRDYEAALGTIESLMHAKRNVPEGDKLDALVALVEIYERRHFPLDFPDPTRNS